MPCLKAAPLDTGEVAFIEGCSQGEAARLVVRAEAVTVFARIGFPLRRLHARQRRRLGSHLVAMAIFATCDEGAR
jgi:hypothetical protein